MLHNTWVIKSEESPPIVHGAIKSTWSFFFFPWAGSMSCRCFLTYTHTTTPHGFSDFSGRSESAPTPHKAAPSTISHWPGLSRQTAQVNPRQSWHRNYTVPPLCCQCGQVHRKLAKIPNGTQTGHNIVHFMQHRHTFTLCCPEKLGSWGQTKGFLQHNLGWCTVASVCISLS